MMGIKEKQEVKKDIEKSVQLLQNIRPPIIGTTTIKTGPPAYYLVQHHMTGKWIYIWIYSIPGKNAPYWDNLTVVHIEIPKTGSLSIQRSKSPIRITSLGHMYSRYIPIRIRSKLRTIVRNPYDRLVSAYFFMIRGGFRNNLNYLFIRNNYDNFEDWVLRGLNRSLTRYNADFNDMEPTIAQFRWLVDEKGMRGRYSYGGHTGSYNYTLMIDRKNIGKFETLEADARRLFCIEKLPHLNKSDRNHWKTYYKNPKVAQKVYDLYKEDFYLFGYDKNKLF